MIGSDGAYSSDIKSICEMDISPEEGPTYRNVVNFRLQYLALRQGNKSFQ